jgi:hypothetical protein
MFDFEDTVLYDMLGVVDFTVDKEAESHKVLLSACRYSLTLSQPYFSLKRAPGTMKGSASR